MISPPRRWKLSACSAAKYFKYFIVAGLLIAASAADRGVAATDRVVSDWHTGLAISGYDPVAYYVDSKPVAGRPEFELEAERAIWRFSNEGNRAAFAARPDIYMPRYGGYDPMALARGVAVAGNPVIWRIVQDRLYLFYDEEARTAFDADPDKAIATADERWPDVRHGLTP
jgi:hypothetical protein